MFLLYYITYNMYSYDIEAIREVNTLSQFVFILDTLHW